MDHDTPLPAHVGRSPMRKVMSSAGKKTKSFGSTATLDKQCHWNQLLRSSKTFNKIIGEKINHFWRKSKGLFVPKLVKRAIFNTCFNLISLFWVSRSIWGNFFTSPRHSAGHCQNTSAWATKKDTRVKRYHQEITSLDNPLFVLLCI